MPSFRSQPNRVADHRPADDQIFDSDLPFTKDQVFWGSSSPPSAKPIELKKAALQKNVPLSSQPNPAFQRPILLQPVALTETDDGEFHESRDDSQRRFESLLALEIARQGEPFVALQILEVRYLIVHEMRCSFLIYICSKSTRLSQTHVFCFDLKKSQHPQVCKRCNRSFATKEKLSKHQSACSNGQPRVAAPMSRVKCKLDRQVSRPREKSDNSPLSMMRACPHCQRTMVPKALEHHARVCENVFGTGATRQYSSRVARR